MKEPAARRFAEAGGSGPPPGLGFTDYLEGIMEARTHPEFKEKFELLEPDLLMGLVFDTPVSTIEEKKILDSMSGLERFGVGVLKKFDKDWSSEEKRELIEKHENNRMHVVF